MTTRKQRVTCVPVNYLLNKCQQIKVTSQLLRNTKQLNYIMPEQAKKGSTDQMTYEDVYLLDPLSGFYTQPIAALNFASLYPSIMMAHNLCYTTFVNVHRSNTKAIQALGLKQEGKDYVITRLSHIFVENIVKQRLLPIILMELISTQKRHKKKLVQTTYLSLKAAMEGRQLALKISANCVYGYTGLQQDIFHVFRYRDMIEETKREVESRYERSNKSYELRYPIDYNYWNQIADKLKFIRGYQIQQISEVFFENQRVYKMIQLKSLNYKSTYYKFVLHQFMICVEIYYSLNQTFSFHKM